MIPTRRRPRPSLADVAQLPLLTAADFTYLGSCRLPAGAFGYVSDRGGLAFDAATGHLWAHDGYGVYELALPDLVATANPAQLPEAIAVQPYFDPADGHLYADMGTTDTKLGGLLPHRDDLVLAAYIYFDANGAAQKSHFRHAKAGAMLSYAGLVKVGTDPKSPGWVSKYMAPVPPEWQPALGGVAITGGGSLPIQSRLPYGFSVGAFNPDDVNRVDPVPVVVLQGQPDTHQTWGAYNAQSEMWNGNSWVNGVALIPGTRTAIWVGQHGTGPFCYGSPGLECTDPENPHHGYHSYPYRYQYWLVDMYEWAEVKAGHRHPWDVRPYAFGGFPLPLPSVSHHVIGCTVDPTERILYLAQARVCGYDSSEPAIHGYRITAGTTPIDPPDPPDPPAIQTSLDRASVSQLFTELAERFEGYDQRPRRRPTTTAWVQKRPDRTSCD